MNCVPLELVSPALEALGNATETPLIAYPNSGETYDAVTKTWGPGCGRGPPGGPKWQKAPKPCGGNADLA